MFAVPIPRDFQPLLWGWKAPGAGDPELPAHGPEYAQGFCFHGRHYLRREDPFRQPAILCQPYARARFGYYRPPLVHEPALFPLELLHRALYVPYGALARIPQESR